MKKIVFLVPYYGKFPNYIREWAYTAGYLAKQSIDFYLITDISVGFELPANIHIIRMTFEELKAKIQSKFDFKISLPSPYNLCDYKPALGYIFSDEIDKYDFWGNCDIDQVWGDVRKFITDDILETYDRVHFLGHFILYRNNRRINEVFKLPGAIYNYKTVYSSPMHYSFCEHSGMMQIIVKNGISNYISNNYADISPRYTRTYISRVKNYRHQILYWEEGKVLRKYIDEYGNVGTDEFMYFHYQQKHPKSLLCWEQGKEPRAFIYHAIGFEEFASSDIDQNVILKKSDFISEAVDKNDNRVYLKRKMLKFIRSPLNGKILWIKQRLATRSLIKNVKYFGEDYSNL